MKIIRMITRIVMVLGTVAVALGAIMLGLLLSSQRGFFGVLNTPQERFQGFSMLGAGVVMILFSLALFKKKNAVPFLVIMGSLVLGLIGFGRMNQEIMLIVSTYFIIMIAGFIVDNYISNKLPQETATPGSESKQRKLSKLLFIIPAGVLLLGWFYISYGHYWLENADIARSQRNAIRKLGYQLYTLKALPTGYSLRETRLGGIYSDYFYAEYRNKDMEYFMLAQFKKPTAMDLTPPQCSIYGGGFDSFEVLDIYGTSSGISSECEMITTPKGIKVYLMNYNISKLSNYAAAVVGDTLVTVTGYTFSQAELVNLYDSLVVGNPTVKAPDMKYYAGD